MLTKKLITLVSGLSNFKSRIGAVLNSSSWLGMIKDWTLSPEFGWKSPARLVPNDTLALDIPTKNLPLVLPRRGNMEEVHAIKVRHIHAANTTGSSIEKWVYSFPTMVVGSATVLQGTWKGNGTFSLEYCEVLLDESKGTCLRQNGYQSTGTFDRHIVSGTHNLSTIFSWRGFQVVIVTISDGLTFDGGLNNVIARWIGLDLESTGSIEFSGGVGSDILSSIRDIAKRSLRSNLLSGLPTDCPTREKHGWLGDAMDTAVAAMYNWWTPSVYSLFMEQIADGQAIGGSSVDGFIPVVVPCHGGTDAASNDISWTAGFTMISRWLLLHYGDVDVVTKYWSNLKRWTNGQLRNASSPANSSGLPTFSTYGDPCAIEQNPHLVGERVSAANFLLALEKMIDIANRLNHTAQRQQWNQTLTNLRHVFDSIWWDTNYNSWAIPGSSQTTQTCNSMALSALVGSETHRSRAAEVLLDDVANRDYQLTVGSAGAKRILSVLSSLGAAGHDAALRMSIGKEYPSWAWWIDEGATTCWEDWHNMTNKHMLHYHGSRNHAWLCGGVSEWLYAVLGGISPSSDGFRTVTIAPKISSTLGPDHVAMQLHTIRGTFKSNWTRTTHLNSTLSAHGVLLMNVSVPISTLATILMPLLTHSPELSCVTGGIHSFQILSNIIWQGDKIKKRRKIRIDQENANFIKALDPKLLIDDVPTLHLTLLPGNYYFSVSLNRCPDMIT